MIPRVTLIVVLAGCGGTEPPIARTPPAPPRDAAPDAPPDAPPDALPGDPTRGFQLTMTKGCLACHSPDGTPRTGPSWLGRWGGAVTTSDGRAVTFDAAYVRRSLLDPEADRVEGFTANMPSYGEHLTDADIDDLVAYLASLAASDTVAP